MPGMSAGPTRRRGVATGALQQVGAVQPGAVNPDDDLVGPGLRDRPIRDLEMAVHDRDRTHEPGT